MRENMNQYNFLELNNSRIMINKAMLNRLIELTKTTIDKTGEQMCIFYGEELFGNNIIFTDLNKETDFTSLGNGSLNPLDHGVEIGKDSLIMRELLSKVQDNKNSRKVICDIHTHLSGISDGDNFRLLSNADINSHCAMAQIMKDRGVEYISGIVAVDKLTGNISISLIWQDLKNDKRIYRIENISIYSIIDDKIQFDGDLKREDNGITYLQENFIPSVVFPSVMSLPKNKQTPVER